MILTVVVSGALAGPSSASVLDSMAGAVLFVGTLSASPHMGWIVGLFSFLCAVGIRLYVYPSVSMPRTLASEFGFPLHG